MTTHYARAIVGIGITPTMRSLMSAKPMSLRIARQFHELLGGVSSKSVNSALDRYKLLLDDAKLLEVFTPQELMFLIRTLSGVNIEPSSSIPGYLRTLELVSSELVNVNALKAKLDNISTLEAVALVQYADMRNNGNQ